MAERAAPRRPIRFDRVDILSRVSLAEVLTREVGHPKRAYGSEQWWPSVDPAPPGTGKTPPTHIVGTEGRQQAGLTPVDQGRQAWDRHGRQMGGAARQPGPGSRGGGAELVTVESDGVEDLAGFR